MGRNYKGPRLFELWSDPSEVAFQHEEGGVFATDRYALWRLRGLPLADPRLVPEQDGFYRIGKTRISKLSKRIDPERLGHLDAKFRQWSGTDSEWPWQAVQLTEWRLRRFRIGISGGGPVLVADGIAELCEQYAPLALSVNHTGGENHKLRLTWTSRVWRHADFGGDYDQHTAVGIVQPGSVPDSEPVAAVLDAIARAHSTEYRVPA